MIAYVEGPLVQVTDNSVVLNTSGGVGYEVYIPGHSLTRLPAVGQPLALYTVHVVREDAQELFGFETWDERSTFLILTSISKVGARTALAMLSVFRPDDLRNLVIDDDPDSLTRVPGIGKKTAQHIFLELKYKLNISSVSSTTGSGASSKASSVYKDTVTGLAGLGYSEEEAGGIVRQLLKADPDLDVSEALRAALKSLAKGR